MKPAFGRGPRHRAAADFNLDAEVAEAWGTYSAPLRRFVLRVTRDPDAADEAVGDAFMDAVRRWADVRDNPAELSKLLYGSVGRRAVDNHRRKTKSRNKSGPVTEYPTDLLPDRPDPRYGGGDAPLEDVHARELWDKLISTVNSPRAAAAAWLRWEQGWTEAEIARELRISRPTVHRDIALVREVASELFTADGRVIPGNPGREE